ncbi:hypothetical protein CAPTEDRAFT_183322 [Capitella teleta]|uniref:ATP-dependent RNA helicase n=1 Tax=Capitella teleta TaxID=283909 RepID=R7VB28_CAPTE|nr:hypothetical protein CAPTEDRAFT_183322 [Capitella teleta]|eukprot:ELU15819.1 hypothetical protein CAPTEDRAFT_183322 [Capitella teleta]
MDEEGEDAQEDESVKKKSKKKKKKEHESEELKEEEGEEEEEEEKKIQEEEEVEEETHENGESVQSQQSKKTVGGFTIIGHVKKRKQEKVSRVLPDWLTKTTSISSDIKSERCPLAETADLDERLITLLEKNGVKDFFPVQARLIPATMNSFDKQFPYALTKGGFRPSDLCCSAATGSGKTLAYVVPIVQALSRRVVPAIRALVVLPVRDLAQQVYKVFCTYCAGTNLKVVLTAGYKSFENEQQQMTFGPNGTKCPADIVITTPGRLVDHLIETKGFCLNELRFLVIDEADRLMKEFKFDWVLKVENAVYHHTYDTSVTSGHRFSPNLCSAAGYDDYPHVGLQKLLFSATLSQNPEVLQQMRLFQPRLFTASEGTDESSQMESINKYVTPASLNEMFIKCEENTKPLVLFHLIHTRKYRQVLCFTNSVKSTHRLCTLLRLMGKVSVEELSSHISINKRQKTLKKFAAGKIEIVVCSDQMARGMDIENAKCVISYDVPNFIQNYVHRVGRTARGGHAGSAITLLDHSQVKFFKEMLHKAGKSDFKTETVKPSELKVYIDAYEDALKEMPKILEMEKKA